MPKGIFQRRKQPITERFWGKVCFDCNEQGCWKWMGGLSKGYGRFYPVHGQETAAHLFAYRLLVGPIPFGLQLDHLCRNRWCCNPQHVEPVTSQVNLLRGIGPTATNAAKVACPRGHPYDLFNTYVDSKGSRHCKQCRLIALRIQYIRGHPNSRGAFQLRTHCPQGHDYTPENTYWEKGRKRHCRICRLANLRMHYARKKTSV